MNILFLDQFSTIGGGQRSLLELLPALRRRGWTAHVGLPGGGTFAEAIRAGGIVAHLIPSGTYTAGHKRAGEFLRYAREIRGATRTIDDLVERLRIDLLYVNGPRLLPAAAQVARRRSLPLIFHCHHRLLQATAIRLAGAALRWAGGSMIACCRFAAEPLEPYVAPGRRRVVYNGVAPPSWTRRLLGFREPYNIGVIGRIEAEKGQLEFMAAARILFPEFPNCRFIVAGAPLFSGPEYFDRVRAASRDLPVEFVGWQDRIGDTFARLHLLVVPSSDIDSTPRVVIEAFAAGLPVVAFPSGGIPEMIEHGRTGFLAESARPAALAATIRSVLEMGAGAVREVGDNARRTWQRKYTLDRFQEEVGDFVAAAAAGTRKRNSVAAPAAAAPDAASTGE